MDFRNWCRLLYIHCPLCWMWLHCYFWYFSYFLYWLIDCLESIGKERFWMIMWIFPIFIRLFYCFFLLVREKIGMCWCLTVLRIAEGIVRWYFSCFLSLLPSLSCLICLLWSFFSSLRTISSRLISKIIIYINKYIILYIFKVHYLISSYMSTILRLFGPYTVKNMGERG